MILSAKEVKQRENANHTATHSAHLPATASSQWLYEKNKAQAMKTALSRRQGQASKPSKRYALTAYPCVTMHPPATHWLSADFQHMAFCKTKSHISAYKRTSFTLQKTAERIAKHGKRRSRWLSTCFDWTAPTWQKDSTARQNNRHFFTPHIPFIAKKHYLCIA